MRFYLNRYLLQHWGDAHAGCGGIRGLQAFPCPEGLSSCSRVPYAGWLQGESRVHAVRYPQRRGAPGPYGLATADPVLTFGSSWPAGIVGLLALRAKAGEMNGIIHGLEAGTQAVRQG
jgi:hypothetical protein